MSSEHLFKVVDPLDEERAKYAGNDELLECSFELAEEASTVSITTCILSYSFSPFPYSPPPSLSPSPSIPSSLILLFLSSPTLSFLLLSFSS